MGVISGAETVYPLKHMSSHSSFLSMGSCCSIFTFLCSFLSTIVCIFMLFSWLHTKAGYDNKMSLLCYKHSWVSVMVFNTNFNNISFISRRSVLFV